mgnify:CR=1 FL=1
MDEGWKCKDGDDGDIDKGATRGEGMTNSG